MADIVVGKSVRLKSGGPIMTVETIDADTPADLKAHCVWFDEKNQPQNATYSFSSLVVVES